MKLEGGRRVRDNMRKSTDSRRGNLPAGKHTLRSFLETQRGSTPTAIAVAAMPDEQLRYSPYRAAHRLKNKQERAAESRCLLPDFIDCKRWDRQGQREASAGSY
jgi:hypothetical protein